MVAAYWLCCPDNICFYCYEQKDVNKYAGGREGGRETEILPHRHHIRQTSRRNSSTALQWHTGPSSSVILFTREINTFSSHPVWDGHPPPLYDHRNQSVYWLVRQWDTHWDICWAAPQNILSLIKVDNKLTQLQLLLDAVDGWVGVVPHWYRTTDGARHYFLFMVLFY